MLIIDMPMPKCCPCELAGGYDIPLPCFACHGIPKRCKEFDECVEKGTKPDWCPIKGELVRCGDCESWDTEHSSGRRSLGNYVCICQEWSDAEDSRWVCTGEDEYCSRGERRAKMEVQDETN